MPTNRRWGCARQTSRRNSKCLPAANSFDSYAEIIADYKLRYRASATRELSFFRRQPSLKRAIELAAFARTSDDKRHPHHQRRSETTLAKVFTALQRSNLRSQRTFDSLHEEVRNAIIGIFDIGELFVYDAAVNIGAFLGLKPETVYLHAGARMGARSLGLRRRKTIQPQELPSPFRQLRPHEIEDCLCLYKKDIERIGQRAKVGRKCPIALAQMEIADIGLRLASTLQCIPGRGETTKARAS